MILGRTMQEIPEKLCVIKETTPIVYFGKFNSARACTISLNPSNREFQDDSGSLLTGSMARLCSRRELAKRDTDALSVKDAEQVIQACNNYFENRPYLNWFNKYERFLKHYSYSYYDGSCVHLDMVQWATKPIWRFLSQPVKAELLREDMPFLLHLLSKEFQHIFLNGRTVVTELSRHIDLSLTTEIVKFNSRNLHIYSGAYNGANVIGWSAYLQSPSVPSYANVDQLANMILEQD